MRIVEQTTNPQLIYSQILRGERLVIVKVPVTFTDGTTQDVRQVVFDRAQEAPPPDSPPAVDFYA
jgi:hypothetical protein